MEMWRILKLEECEKGKKDKFEKKHKKTLNIRRNEIWQNP